MSDSDSSSGIQHPLVQEYTGSDNDPEEPTSSSTTPPLMLDGSDSVPPSPVKPDEASMGFETPAPTKGSVNAQTTGRVSGDRPQTRHSASDRAASAYAVEQTPVSDESTATARQNSSAAPRSAVSASGSTPREQSEPTPRQGGSVGASGPALVDEVS